MMCILLNKYVDCCLYMPEQQILNVNNFLKLSHSHRHSKFCAIKMLYCSILLC